MNDDNPHTAGSVLCCKCGIPISPNAANMCASCLRSEVDITEGLQKHVTIIQCPGCDSYLQPPWTWIKIQIESQDLLDFCLKRLTNLHNHVHLVDHPEFVWTEPHSKRIKVMLKVRKRVLNGVLIEQAYVVEYIIQDQLCESCSRVQSNPDQWVAAVQLRQNISHRGTFYYLEQVILSHDAARDAVKIKLVDQGMDFFFNKRSHALKFVEFVAKVAPIRTRGDKQLISESIKYTYKFTFSVEISPICRGDLICLPQKVAIGLGDFGPVVLCDKVTDRLSLFDPFTLMHRFLDGEQYWRLSFKALLSGKGLVEYIVLDLEMVSGEINVGGSNYVLADAQVARLSDFGKNNMIFNVRTHLGHLLKPGDYALGYDLYGMNINEIEMGKCRGFLLPDVVLVRKTYEGIRQWKKGKRRCWKLKSLKMEVDNGGRDNGEKMESEYEQFLRDLEENPDLRFNLSLYRNKECQPSETGSITDHEDVPGVPLEELLADMDLSDEDDDGMTE